MKMEEIVCFLQLTLPRFSENMLRWSRWGRLVLQWLFKAILLLSFPWNRHQVEIQHKQKKGLGKPSPHKFIQLGIKCLEQCFILPTAAYNHLWFWGQNNWHVMSSPRSTFGVQLQNHTEEASTRIDWNRSFTLDLDTDLGAMWTHPQTFQQKTRWSVLESFHSSGAAAST